MHVGCAPHTNLSAGTTSRNPWQMVCGAHPTLMWKKTAAVAARFGTMKKGGQLPSLLKHQLLTLTDVDDGLRHCIGSGDDLRTCLEVALRRDEIDQLGGDVDIG